MKTEVWIETLRQAYEFCKKPVPSDLTGFLLSKLDTKSDDVVNDCECVFWRFFFHMTASGQTFGPVEQIAHWYGGTVEQNYGVTHGEFLKLARTYWTYKCAIRDVMIGEETENTLLRRVLGGLDSNIGTAFFPMGSASAPASQRRLLQEQLIDQFGPEIDKNDLLTNNPILSAAQASQHPGCGGCFSALALLVLLPVLTFLILLFFNREHKQAHQASCDHARQLVEVQR